MDVPLGPDGEQSIVTAARAAAVLLAERKPLPRLAMVLGGPGLSRELRDVGIAVVPPTERRPRRRRRTRSSWASTFR